MMASEEIYKLSDAEPARAEGVKKPPIIEAIETIMPPIVLKHIEKLKTESNRRVSCEETREAFERFDYLYHVTRMDEKARKIIDGVALATAYASFQPGGYTVFGTHYESRLKAQAEDRRKEGMI